jgi:hypothetical protein
MATIEPFCSLNGLLPYWIEFIVRFLEMCGVRGVRKPGAGLGKPVVDQH